ncbi:MAG: DUF2071 domain-containing protein [Deltaproteobacteria bacterium]|nr:DUF2071 domain-containing protein [Deltaproteobacteria bacterium]
MDLTISTTLEHLTLVTWLVPEARLRGLLPAGLAPSVVPSPGGPLGMFSLAVMVERGMAFRLAPWLGLTFPQLNERAYVTLADGSGAGVYFWRSQVASRSYALPRYGLGLPYERAQLSLEVSDERRILSRDGTPVLDVEVGASQPAPEGVDLDRVREVTGNPMVGYSLLRGRRLAAFPVEHPPIAFQEARVRAVDPRGMVAEGALEPGQAPAVAVYAASSEFVIHLPPRRV